MGQCYRWSRSGVFGREQGQSADPCLVCHSNAELKQTESTVLLKHLTAKLLFNQQCVKWAHRWGLPKNWMHWVSVLLYPGHWAVFGLLFSRPALWFLLKLIQFLPLSLNLIFQGTLIMYYAWKKSKAMYSQTPE